MLGIFSFFCCRLLTFFKVNFFKNILSGTLSVSNDLDLALDRHSVGPDLGPNRLQRLSVDDKSCH